MTEDVIPHDIRRLLSQHTFEVDPDCIGEDLSCAICSKVMVDAYQTHCGCKYCRVCILTYMDGGNTHCGGRTKECKEEPLVLGRSVFPNNILNKKILRVKVRCINQPCNFTSKLTDMEDHLRVCPQQPIECPYTMIGCGNAGASRDTVETHLETLSHSEMLMAVINNMRNELGGLRESCSRDEASLHENARREMRGLVEALAGRLEEVEASRHREKAELVGLIEDQRRTMAALTKTIGGIEEESRKRDVEMEAVKRELRAMREDAVRLEAENVEMRRKAIEGEGRVATAVKQADEGHRAISSSSMGRDREGAVGELWFTVDRIRERMGRWETIDSPYLYSHANGYKVRIRVETARWREGYMPVSSIVCKGEYDELLPWPCRFIVSVAAVDKHNEQPYATWTIKYDSDTDSRYSNKPTNTDNPPHGRTSISSVLSQNVNNDSLLLRIRITR